MNQTIADQQGWWEAVFLHAVDAILLVNQEGRFVAANPAVCALLGFTQQELLQLTVWEITPGPHREQLPDFAKKLFTQGKIRGTFTLQRKDRTTVEVDYHAVAHITPGIHLSIFHDLSDRKRIEGALHQSEEKFAAFMDHLPAFAWMKGLDGRYIFLNKLCRETAYKNSPDYLGRTDDELWPAMVAAQYKQNDQMVLQTRRALQAVEMLYVGDDLHHAIVSKFPILNEQGQPMMIGGVGLDVTEWKRAEERQQRLFQELQTANKQLRHLTRQVLAAQEKERQRISRELHDEAAQALTAIKLILQGIEDELPDTLAAQRQQLHNAVALTDATMEGIRRLSLDLRPTSLDVLSLNQSLEELCLEFGRRTGLSIEYSGVELPPQPDEMNICLYRVLQEALTNVSKHAGASRVRVQLQCAASGLSLTVEDNGKGFAIPGPVAPSAAHGGLGLIGMNERLELLRGRLQMESKPGTKLMAWIPLEQVG